jgi:hypothetical protein
MRVTDRSSRPRSARVGLRIRLYSVAALPLVFVLSGCAQAGSPDATPTNSAVAPIHSSGPQASGAAPGIDCEELVPDVVMNAFAPGFTADASFTPAPGSHAALIVAINGVACGWTNETTGKHITLALAKPSRSSVGAIEKELASQSSPTNVFGTPPDVTGFFSISNGVGDGEATLGGGSYWVSVSSSLFSVPQDASALLASVAQALPSG